ncbi:uncharacterized protein LOC123685325 [Harmonia axyridis]|uniref:uncharacterized protein LOC123685325 n=1 Tax=Harmonia axyridis TaxID=115357 RepID=UPI001E275C89|nr:uncharacterized protein LOC123685325 [Harmonia axyridis]
MNKKFLRRREVKEKTKMTVFKTIFRPILTYGCEAWNTTRNMRSKLQAVEMKFLRGVKGFTSSNRRRNEDIRGELGVISLEQFVGQRQLGWWGHLHRMKKERPVRQIWEAKTDAKPRRGRPQHTWENMIEKEITKREKSVREAISITSNRIEWKNFI